ncbi:4-hydroxybenzoate octaprenyltransferase [Rickettsiaceae bacterium]|nr:4-hydroxybenzoate octaprenyltransferase [Rickettsiaceae bacterium]
MPNKNLSITFLDISNLVRLHTPTGYLLSFFPAAYGLLLAYNQSLNLVYLPIFFIGSILTRGAGCIVNDLFDRDLDKHVERTKRRPLASGVISAPQAIMILCVLLCGSVAILFSLTMTSIAIGVIGALLITLYPLMKRITYFPQVFLGITFNIGCLIAYAAITDDISNEAMILYIACGFWTVGYDTIYAFSDIKDDKKMGMKSTAIFFEHKSYKMYLGLFYMIFFLLFACANIDSLGVFLIFSLVASMAIALCIIVSLDISNPQNCFARFKVNNYIGFALFFGMLLEKL